MSDWQSTATYNKIGLQVIGIGYRRMSVEATEIDLLNSLNPQAISDIHARYYPDVFRFARFRVSDEAIAEDIAGDVFMHLLEAVHNGRGPVTNLPGWLMRTTANLVNNHFRKLYNQPREESSELLDGKLDLYLPQSDPVAESDLVEKNRLLQNALAQLTDVQKLVITLRFGNRYTLEETARLMGRNTNAIKALQYRALLALRRKLGSEMI